MKCTTFIDESGNTGDDLNSKDQKFFVLGAVTLPDSAFKNCSSVFDTVFNDVCEIGETEIKATNWVRSKKKRDAMQAILNCIMSYGASFSLILIEKRFMISAIIVDNFLDGAYNDIDDYTWVNDFDEKKKAAQYFYKLLPDEEVQLIFEAFRKPEFKALSLALQKVISYTKEPRYLKMLKGCVNHLQELYNDDVAVSSSFAVAGVSRSPNYTAFSALGCIIAKQCRAAGNTTEILFDHCNLVDQSYADLYKTFSNMAVDSCVEQLTKLISWKNLIIGFRVSNSKSVNLLQTADIFATSSLKTLRKVFGDDNSVWTDYDDYIKRIITCLLAQDSFTYVMAEDKIDLMAKCLLPCPNKASITLVGNY